MSPSAKTCGKTDCSPAVENTFWEPLALAAAEADPSQALDRTMEVIATIFHADRAWIGRYNTTRTHFWGVSDWVSSGVVSHLQEMQGVSVDMLGAAHQIFLEGGNVAIPDVERLIYDGTLIGFYGFDHVLEVAAWTPADLDRLPALGKFLAALLHRSLTTSPPADLPANSKKSLHITDPGGLRALSPDDIIFIKADGDYSRVYTVDGHQHFERRSLRTWIAQLPRERFLRVHQSYLVNGSRIARLDRGPRWTLQLQDIPDPIPVGRAFRHAVRLHIGF
jgi:hypothetical protein